MRRTLRVQDNLALWTALQESGEAIPVVFLRREPRYREDTPRRRFILATLKDLQGNLEERGSRLVIRYGTPADALPHLAAEVGVQAVYATAVHDKHARERDEVIRGGLERQGVSWHLLPDSLLLQPGDVLTATGQPCRVFTPFKRAWMAAAGNIPGVLPRIPRLPAVPDTIRSEALPESPSPGPGGETAADQRWREFLRGSMVHYAQRRDLVGEDGTSKMSAYLAHGAISARRLYHDAVKFRRTAGSPSRAGLDLFLSELVWREFYAHIAAQFPHVVERAFRDEMADIPWVNDRVAFDAWVEGRTGYPIVDAAMRQLREEGWVHNRARMIAASFLTKDLQIDWRWGEAVYRSRLIDADIASNNGGWQWTAGTGTDASPWFRIFNPVTQGKRFDHAGAYVRKYVPELAGVPDRQIHSPWVLTAEQQRSIGVVIGRTYPAPIVDHARAREKTLLMYRSPGIQKGRRK